MRYYTQFGSHPEVKGCFSMTGPQGEDQVCDEVRALLDKPGVTEVVLLFNHGQGDRIETIRKMPDEFTCRGQSSKFSG